MEPRHSQASGHMLRMAFITPSTMGCAASGTRGSTSSQRCMLARTQSSSPSNVRLPTMPVWRTR